LQTTNYGYDTFGRMISIFHPPVDHDNNSGTAMVRPETKFGFSAFGQQISITDANNRVTAFTYDKYGQQTSRKLPAVGGVSAKEEKFFTQYGQFDNDEHTS
jgi:YD repeat-containing protein